MTDRLELLPAVDVADGQAVRLTQGAAGTETGYGDPLSAALDWYAGGAEWIHLVDLDAAFGRGSNADLLAEVTAELVGKGVKVELSGGIRDDASVERALGTGATRDQPRHGRPGEPGVDRPASSGRYGEQIAVGPRRARHDARRARLDEGRRGPLGGARPARGRRLRALRRHRRQQGRHAATARTSSCCSRCAPAPTRPVIASGGVSSLEDLRVLRTLVPLGVEGAIVGKALYAGAFTLPEALDVAGRP